MRLNGWHRLGVALSLLWFCTVLALGFGYDYGWIDPLGSFALPLSAFTQPDTSGETRYADLAAQGNYTTHYFGLNGIALYGLLPILMAWSAVYLSRFAYQWIAAGFEGGGDGNRRG